jgi:hypothetical protein
MPRPSAGLAGSAMTRTPAGSPPARSAQQAARTSGGDQTGHPQAAADEVATRRQPLAMTNGAGGIVDASRNGLRLDPRMPFDAWKALGARIKVRSDASSWWLGDWLMFGRQQYGDRHKEAFEVTGLDDQTLDNFGVVARRFDLSRRRENLSFQHHADVCEMGDAAQDHWLNLAARNGWPKAELRLRIRDAARTSGALPDGHVLRFSLKLETSRERAWRDAAAAVGLRLEEWMVRVLDDASS